MDASGGNANRDALLVYRLREGDKQAFAAVMQSHNRALWRIARAILKDEADAEEAVQEAYLRAFSSIHTFRHQSSLSTWLTRIAINEALRLLAKRRALLTLTSGSAHADPDHRAMKPVLTPEQESARHEIRRMVERAVDDLPEPFRLVFLMRMVEQMSIEDTAAALCIDPGTVKTRLHRATERLRRSLGAELASVIEGAFPFAGGRCQRLVAAVLARLPPRISRLEESQGEDQCVLKD